MSELIRTEVRGHVLTVGLDRPDKRNAVNRQMMREISAAYSELCDAPDLRCAVLYSTSDMFCAGLDLIDMAPLLMQQAGVDDVIVTDDQVDVFNWAGAAGRPGRRRSKPVVTAVNGKCLTAGIELALSTDIVVAEASSVFAQAEVRWGMMPLGGAIERFTQRLGWGDAMRLLLTGDEFSAAEAHRLGLVQEVVSDGGAFDRAFEIAERIAANAPLGVQGVIENAYVALDDPQHASKRLRPYGQETISPSKDLQEGVAAVFQKRAPIYKGH
ncbi:MAG: crotonase/enoyl-CoA hydratase family protein [Pseudomonadota bacterium]